MSRRPRAGRRPPRPSTGPSSVGGSEPARGTLYVVATPIGNLEDLSPRAAATLGTCRLVACEDTRVTRVILDRHGITAQVMSCHRFNEAAAARRILEVLTGGGDVALVSDGGTPAVSDPGDVVVRAARAAGLRVVPIPGPSAAAALWSVSGFSGPFTVQGFLPSRAGERRRAIEALAAESRPFILYESPHRILATLDDAVAVLGDRDCCLGREMTKIHEEILAGSLSSVRARLAGREVRGEIALVVAGRPTAQARGAPGDPAAAASEARRLIAAGVPRAEAVRRAARAAGVPRRALYQDLLRDTGGAGRTPDATALASDGDSEE